MPAYWQNGNKGIKFIKTCNVDTYRQNVQIIYHIKAHMIKTVTRPYNILFDLLLPFFSCFRIVSLPNTKGEHEHKK